MFYESLNLGLYIKLMVSRKINFIFLGTSWDSIKLYDIELKLTI
ncbi:MAG: hypothetical protein BAJALOKI2v1_10019 [Promethearchaeota archaeon]|nr:MAG: hypothetical protein BAJALOKI2v1_10019 [Candidatus Lokiarchaeota archaeon]